MLDLRDLRSVRLSASTSGWIEAGGFIQDHVLLFYVRIPVASCFVHFYIFSHVFERRNTTPFAGLRLWYHSWPWVRTAQACNIG